MNNINQINNNAHQVINKNKKSNITNPDTDTFKQTFGKVLENMQQYSKVLIKSRHD